LAAATVGGSAGFCAHPAKTAASRVAKAIDLVMWNSDVCPFRCARRWCGSGYVSPAMILMDRRAQSKDLSCPET